MDSAPPWRATSSTRPEEEFVEVTCGDGQTSHQDDVVDVGWDAARPAEEEEEDHIEEEGMNEEEKHQDEEQAQLTGVEEEEEEL